jgi:hypothetical protein
MSTGDGAPGDRPDTLGNHVSGGFMIFWIALSAAWFALYLATTPPESRVWAAYLTVDGVGGLAVPVGLSQLIFSVRVRRWWLVALALCLDLAVCMWVVSVWLPR